MDMLFYFECLVLFLQHYTYVHIEGWRIGSRLRVIGIFDEPSGKIPVKPGVDPFGHIFRIEILDSVHFPASVHLGLHRPVPVFYHEGGNAVDAAVAVGYALAVTHPQAGNLGGGGFMLIRTKDGNTTAIDFREMAPAKATRDMFLDDQGNPDSKKSLPSHLASGTPGTVAGFSLALEKYGTMPLNKVVQPAFKLARDGFIVNDALADDLKTYGSEVLPNHENSKAIFWKEGEPLKKGDTLVQANLAKSL